MSTHRIEHAIGRDNPLFKSDPYKKYPRTYRSYSGGGTSQLDGETLNTRVLRLDLRGNDHIFYPGAWAAREDLPLLYMKSVS